MPETCRVVPLTPIDGTFTYRVPAPLAPEAVPGARVLVPFGRRTITGVIADRTEEDRDGLKDLLDVLDEAPSFTPTLLALTRWIADYYVCAWGDVLRAALPAGATRESRRVVRALRPPDPDLPAAASRVLEALLDGPCPAEALVGDGITHHLLRRLAQQGLVAIEQELEAPAARIRTAIVLRLAAGASGDALRGAKQRAIVAHLQARLAEGVSEAPQAEVLAATGAASGAVKALVEKGILERVEREVVRTPFDDHPPEPPPLALHAAQQAALEAVVEALDRRRQATFLLHGVTGSGKTEVYIQALRRTLAQGRTGIVLVPEIALTPQTVRRFRAHFGDRVAVLHSRMSAGERFDAWRHLQGGRFDVAIGPRSAIFAPLANVGLIVVDEEHEGSYKQFDPAPRYHARDVAVMRAHLEGAVCVLGSATPSMESLSNASGGKYRRIAMPLRVPVAGHAAAPLPEVTVVDLTWERRVKRLKGALSHPLREAMRARLAKGEGVILLQNRRGYSPVITCGACGNTPACRDCAVSLTYHASHGHLRCHYCGRVERMPRVCPACEEDALERLGVGTQRVEEEIANVFPEARVLRMDLDTTSRRDAHRQLLDAFASGEADILLGTQMVAKGLDFPRVTLVGIVDADTGLTLPDFRAAERTFQLLMQVAGRAGRGDLRGEVILQTRRPEHPAVIAASRHDFELFASGELEERRALGYPPFGRIAGVEFRGPDERAVADVAARWTETLRQRGGSLEILGPEPALVGRVKRQYRYHTIIKAGRQQGAHALSRVLRDTAAAFGTPPKGVRVNVDVDAAAIV